MQAHNGVWGQSRQTGLLPHSHILPHRVTVVAVTVSSLKFCQLLGTYTERGNTYRTELEAPRAPASCSPTSTSLQYYGKSRRIISALSTL